MTMTSIHDTASLDRFVGYLGWSGRGNLGDDVLFDVVATALPEISFAGLPMTMRELASSIRGKMWRGRANRPLILGGGTAVGRANWRLALRAASLSCGAENHLIGVGVENPSFSGRNSFSGLGELRRWRRPLQRFERVTVRGPHSARLLENIGVSAEVVGDPALLLEPADDRRSDGVDRIAISLGFGDDLWGHYHEKVVTAIAGVALRFVRMGRGVTLVVVNPADTCYAKEVASLLPDGVVRMTFPKTAEEFFVATADCAVMVAERLHAGILAVSAGIPTVMLEYQPKCRDFMDSVGLGHRCVRTDQIDVPGLVEMIDDSLENPEEARRTHRNVDDLRRRLNREVEHLVDAIQQRVADPGRAR